ncbi:MAG: hypothetical protein E6R06_27135 [Mycobacterium sp.]|nr:MAG: hypothetical protein E6R06_27135 [Mycobacterium sp.]
MKRSTGLAKQARVAVGGCLAAVCFFAGSPMGLAGAHPGHDHGGSSDSGSSGGGGGSKSGSSGKNKRSKPLCSGGDLGSATTGCAPAGR